MNQTTEFEDRTKFKFGDREEEEEERICVVKVRIGSSLFFFPLRLFLTLLDDRLIIFTTLKFEIVFPGSWAMIDLFLRAGLVTDTWRYNRMAKPNQMILITKTVLKAANIITNAFQITVQI